VRDAAAPGGRAAADHDGVRGRRRHERRRARGGGARAGDPRGHLPLQAARETIGRAPDADLFLDDVTVSREHAIIEREPDGFYLRDLESLNGTYVNRTRVTRHRLADGDEVQVGKFKLTFLEH